MDNVQKKIALDLFAHPATVIAGTAGLTSLMLGWAIGVPILYMTGLAGVLIAGGTLATRWIFGLGKIAEDAHQYIHQQKIHEQEQELDSLDEKLARDGDKRTHRALRTLRDIYRQLSEDIDEGRIKGNTHDILERVEELFQACIEQLKSQLYIAEDIRDSRLKGKAKKKAEAQREQAIQDVVLAVEDLSSLVAQYHEINVNRSESKLSSLREELKRSMDVAAATEKQRDALFEEDKGYDVEKFKRRAAQNE